MIKVINNFLFYGSDVYKLCKSMKLFDAKTFNETFNAKQIWPGYRSEDFRSCVPFLYIYLLDLIKIKFELNMEEYEKIEMYTHLRLKEDEEKDWKHIDESDTVIINLSPTNLSSGTHFYNESEDLINTFFFNQSNAVYFKEGILHSAFGHHGSSIEDGRYTINIFLKKFHRWKKKG